MLKLLKKIIKWLRSIYGHNAVSIVPPPTESANGYYRKDPDNAPIKRVYPKRRTNKVKKSMPRNI